MPRGRAQYPHCAGFATTASGAWAIGHPVRTDPYDAEVLLDALDRIAYSSVAITAASLQQVAGTELTFLGWRVLVILGDDGGRIRVGDLGTRLGLSRPSVSKLVRRLERRGLVALSPDESDRRAVLAAVTPEGVALRSAVIARRRAILEDALAQPLPDRVDTALDALAGRLERRS
jgi:DNA-binding MarR family transcriptional regulator